MNLSITRHLECFDVFKSIFVTHLLEGGAIPENRHVIWPEGVISVQLNLGHAWMQVFTYSVSFALENCFSLDCRGCPIKGKKNLGIKQGAFIIINRSQERACKSYYKLYKILVLTNNGAHLCFLYIHNSVLQLPPIPKLANIYVMLL